MKIDLKQVFDLLTEVENKLGTWSAVLLIVLVVVFIVTCIYLKYFIKSSAEESSKKTIEEFKNQLNKSLQTQIGLFFRDESIRNSLLISIGQKSFEKKIEYWQLTQSLYFEYQKIWSFSEDTNINDYVELDNKLNGLRIKLFNETVYLGYELSQNLIRQNSLMRENVRLKRTEFVYSGKNYQPYHETQLQSTLNRLSNNDGKITESLSEIEKWIMTKLHSDQTIDKFEFTTEQLNKIKEERNRQFDNI
jgi:hypothetical protein